MKLFTVVVVAAIGVFAFKDEISVYAGKARRIANQASATSDRGAGLNLERLGAHPTMQDRAWVAQMNVLCGRRNVRLHAASREPARALVVWDRYMRQAAKVRVPDTYAKEASWLRIADEGRRRAIEAVSQAARTGDREATARAIGAYRGISDRMQPNLVKIGLARCVI